MKNKKSLLNIFQPVSKIPEILSQKHLPSLDGMRAVSILIVVLAHLNYRINNSLIWALVGDGRIGVYVFLL